MLVPRVLRPAGTNNLREQEHPTPSPAGHHAPAQHVRPPPAQLRPLQAVLPRRTVNDPKIAGSGGPRPVPAQHDTWRPEAVPDPSPRRGGVDQSRPGTGRTGTDQAGQAGHDELGEGTAPVAVRHAVQHIRGQRAARERPHACKGAVLVGGEGVHGLVRVCLDLYLGEERVQRQLGQYWVQHHYH